MWMIGYSLVQKGYKCDHPPSRKDPSTGWMLPFKSLSTILVLHLISSGEGTSDEKENTVLPNSNTETTTTG